MLATEAAKLLEKLHESNLVLPAYDEDTINQIHVNINDQYDRLGLELQNTPESARALPVIATHTCRDAVLKRLKRCILAYFYHRSALIRMLRREIGPIIPQSIRIRMSDSELRYYQQYCANQANYMQALNENRGFDIYQFMDPPKSIYIEVRCSEHVGFNKKGSSANRTDIRIQTKDGFAFCLHPDSHHLMKVNDAEHLVRLGNLEEIPFHQ